MNPPSSNPIGDMDLDRAFRNMHRRYMGRGGGRADLRTIQGGRLEYFPSEGPLESLQARYAESVLDIALLVTDIAQSPVDWTIGWEAKKEAKKKGLSKDQTKIYVADQIRTFAPTYKRMGIWRHLNDAEKWLVEQQENLNLVRVYHQTPGGEGDYISWMAEGIVKFGVGMLPWVPSIMNPAFLKPTVAAFASHTATERLRETGSMGAAMGSGVLDYYRTLAVFTAAGAAAQRFGAAYGGMARGARLRGVQEKIREAEAKMLGGSRSAAKEARVLEEELGLLLRQGRTNTLAIRLREVTRALPLMTVDILGTAGLKSAVFHQLDQIQMGWYLAEQHERSWGDTIEGLWNSYKAGIHEGGTILALGLAHSAYSLRRADGKSKRDRQKALADNGTFEADIRATMDDSILLDFTEAVKAVENASKSPEGLGTLRRLAKNLAERRARASRSVAEGKKGEKLDHFEDLSPVELQMETIILERLSQLDVPAIDVTATGRRRTGQHAKAKLEGSERSQRYYEFDDGMVRNSQHPELATETYKDWAEFEAEVKKTTEKAETLADLVKRDPKLDQRLTTRGQTGENRESLNRERPKDEAEITEKEASQFDPKKKPTIEEVPEGEGLEPIGPSTSIRDKTDKFLPEGDIRTTQEFQNRRGDLSEAVRRGDVKEAVRILKELREMVADSKAFLAKKTGKIIDKVRKTKPKSKEEAIEALEAAIEKIDSTILEYARKQYKKAIKRANAYNGESVRESMSSRLGDINMDTRKVSENWREEALANKEAIANKEKDASELTEREVEEINLLEKRHYTEVVDPVDLMTAAREVSNITNTHYVLDRVLQNRRKLEEVEDTETILSEIDRVIVRGSIVKVKRKKVRKRRLGRFGEVKPIRTFKRLTNWATQVQLSTLVENLGGGETSKTFDYLYRDIEAADLRMVEGERIYSVKREEFIQNALGLTKSEAAALSDHIGSRSSTEKISVKADVRGKDGKYTEKTMDIRVNDLVDVIQHLMDVQTRRLFVKEEAYFWVKGTPYDGGFRLSKDAIKRLVNPSAKQHAEMTKYERLAYDVAKWQFDYVQTVLRPMMVDYQTKSGRPITIYDKWYTRRWREAEGRETDISNVFDEVYSEGTIESMSMTKKRMEEKGGYDNALVISDGMMGMELLVRQTYGLVNLGPAIARAKRLMERESVKSLFKDTNIEVSGKQIDKYLKGITENVMGKQGKGARSAIKTPVSIITAGQLVFNVGVGVGQVFSLTFARMYMPGHYLNLSRNQLRYSWQLGHVKARAMRNPRIWQRFTQSPEGIINPGVATEGQALSGMESVGIRQKSGQIGWFLVRKTDGYVILRIWHGTELQVVDMIRKARRGERVQDHLTREDITSEVRKLDHLLDRRGEMRDWNDADFFSVVERLALRTINKSQPTFNVLNLSGIGLARRESPVAHAFLMFRGYRDKVMDMLYGSYFRSMRQLETKTGEIGKLAAEKAAELKARKAAVEKGEAYVGRTVIIPKGSALVAGRTFGDFVAGLIVATNGWVLWKEIMKEAQGRESMFSSESEETSLTLYLNAMADAFSGLYFIGDYIRSGAELMAGAFKGEGGTGYMEGIETLKEASPLGDAVANGVHGGYEISKGISEYIMRGGDVGELTEAIESGIYKLKPWFGRQAWPISAYRQGKDMLMEHAIVTEKPWVLSP